jgi:hypothetical protein
MGVINRIGNILSIISNFRTALISTEVAVSIEPRDSTPADERKELPEDQQVLSNGQEELAEDLQEPPETQEGPAENQEELGEYSAEESEDWATSDNTTAVEKVQAEVVRAWRSRHRFCRYKQVIVLLISWKDHNLGDDVEEC